MKIKRAIGWLLVLVVAVLSPMLLPSCTLIGLPVSGQVLDPQTGEPVPGVIVVGLWRGEAFGLIEGFSTCFHVETAVTDDKGHYRLGPWVNLDWKALWPVFDHYVSVTAYHAGYEQIWHVEARPKKGVVYLRRFSGTTTERLEAVRVAAVSCGSAGISRRNLLPLYRLLYEEAQPLAVTKQGKLIVNALLRDIELIELPYEQAEERARKRKRALRREFPDE